jgi:hypothetical protein
MAANGRKLNGSCTGRIWRNLFIATAERYEHSAILIHPNPGRPEETRRNH